MILVTGGTGTTGSDVVRGLAEAGAERVRVMTRDPARAAFARDAGFEVVAGDFDRPETLDAALAGVEKALLLSAPDPRQVAQQSAFIQAARRAGTRHVVKLSAIGADASAARGGIQMWHGRSEDELKASGVAYTMLQPNVFMQNLLGSARTVAEQGGIYQPLGGARVAFVDARDVAAVAVRALTEGGHEGKTYVLTGPEALTYYEVAERLSEVVGREVRYVPVSPEQFREGALGQGLPAWLVDMLERLNEMLAAGEAARVTAAVREVTGTEPRPLRVFARDYAGAFQAGA